MTSPLLSVVIPTHQRCASVRRLLEALLRQTVPFNDYEVIVAIDGSDDSTQRMVNSFSTPFPLRAVAQPHRGRAAACNLGIREARGRVVVILDDDMEPRPGFLAGHVARHQTGERIGVVGAAPIEIGPNTPQVVRYIAAKFNGHLARLERPETVIEVRDFYSGNFSIRRDLLVEVAGFDEEFEIYGNEDGDLAARLQRAKVQLAYAPEAEARQHYEKDFRTLALDNLAKGRTAVLCATKHPDKVARLRIGSTSEGTARWRLLRAGLIRASLFSGRIPERVIRWITRLEQGSAPRLFSWYGHALDYFFWLGVARELRERNRAGDDRARQLLRMALKAVP